MRQFDFYIGAKVKCQDKHCGELAGIVVDPETQRMTGVIIKEGFLLPQNRVSPISQVQGAIGEEIYLSLRSDEFDFYPEYRVEEYEEPAAGLAASPPSVPSPQNFQQYGMVEPVVPMVKKLVQKGIVPGQVVIKQGMAVRNFGGEIGKVERVIADSKSAAITHLVVRRGLIFSEQLMVPISAVESIAEGNISVSCTSQEVELLPLYNEKELDLIR